MRWEIRASGRGLDDTPVLVGVAEGSLLDVVRAASSFPGEFILRPAPENADVTIGKSDARRKEVYVTAYGQDGLPILAERLESELEGCASVLPAGEDHLSYARVVFSTR